jgi:hypothetical protein
VLELLLNGALFVVAGRRPAFRYWLGYHFCNALRQATSPRGDRVRQGTLVGGYYCAG